MRVAAILLLASMFIAGGCVSTKTGPRNLAEFESVRDGHTFASPAINAAIAQANSAGGGIVTLPAGRYLCNSIHLKSNVELHLQPGCVIVANKTGGYDPAEPNEWHAFQDYGHSHWHNSLIWGEDLHDVSITGLGMIDGSALSDGYADRVEKAKASTSRSATTTPDSRDTLMPTPKDGDLPPPPSSEHRSDVLINGAGNKAICLKNCHNVTLRDLSILRGGHFAILATGVDNLTIDHLLIDTNRDGMDVDCCKNVHISNCSINSPNDDGICLKSSYGLGRKRSTQDVTIANCFVTGGYHIGTLLRGTRERYSGSEHAWHNGRIKFGTESNGGFQRIAVTNCVLDYSGGVFIESMDGALVEDIAVSNLVMRDVSDSPLFIRLGRRLRGPGPPDVGIIRRISVDNVIASNVNWRSGCIITGIPGHPVQDISISNLHVQNQGGGAEQQAKLEPPEREDYYPDPLLFGTLPVYGFFVRHATGVQIRDSTFQCVRPDQRSVMALWDVDGIELRQVQANQGVELNRRNARGVKLEQSLGFDLMLPADQPAATRPTTQSPRQ